MTIEKLEASACGYNSHLLDLKASDMQHFIINVTVVEILNSGFNTETFRQAIAFPIHLDSPSRVHLANIWQSIMHNAFTNQIVMTLAVSYNQSLGNAMVGFDALAGMIWSGKENR